MKDNLVHECINCGRYTIQSPCADCLYEEGMLDESYYYPNDQEVEDVEDYWWE